MPEPEELMPRQPERRTGPRREADRTLHYATQNLLAAALAAAESGGPAATLSHPFGVLRTAAAQYRRAESVAVPT